MAKSNRYKRHTQFLLPSTDKERRSIHRTVFLGDSLTDPGNMKNRRIGGILPIPGTGLDKSGTESFADGCIWADFVTRKRIEKALTFVKQINRNYEPLANDYQQKLDNELVGCANLVTCNGIEISRNYAQGGATSAQCNVIKSIAEEAREEFRSVTEKPVKYIIRPRSSKTLWGRIKTRFWDFVDDVKESFATAAALGAQAIVTNVRNERIEFLKDEKKKKVTQADRDVTLIVEWSGANDLITVNTEIAHEPEDVLRAVNARMKNIRRLYNKGYKNAVLLTLPDLSLTPEYAGNRATAEKRKGISDAVTSFNLQLTQQFNEFKAKHADFKGEIFDAHAEFSRIYNNAEANGFDDALKTDCLVADPNYELVKVVNPPNPRRMMFWNEVHPTTKLHEQLADRFLEFTQAKGFSFDDSQAELVARFRQNWQPQVLPEARHNNLAGGLPSSLAKSSIT